MRSHSVLWMVVTVVAGCAPATTEPCAPARPSTAVVERSDAGTASATDGGYPITRFSSFTWVVDYEPSWSPDGRQIALISSRHGGMKVHLLDASGTDHGAMMKQLTFGSSEDDSPAFSPDGRHIAFVSVREGVSQIYVMSTDGSDAHPLTRGHFESIHPAWSIDSARVLINTTAFAAAVSEAHPGGETRPIGDATDDAMDLATVRIDGTDMQRITTGGGYTYASYAPDGKQIVHRRIKGAVSKIFVMDANGAKDHDISGMSTEDGWPSWSPDGTRIVFARHVGESMQIFAMERDGSRVMQLTDAKGRFTNPRWSPDGKTILCSRSIGDMTLITFPAPQANR